MAKTKVEDEQIYQLAAVAVTGWTDQQLQLWVELCLKEMDRRNPKREVPRG